MNNIEGKTDASLPSALLRGDIGRPRREVRREAPSTAIDGIDKFYEWMLRACDKGLIPPDKIADLCIDMTNSILDRQSRVIRGNKTQE